MHGVSCRHQGVTSKPTPQLLGTCQGEHFGLQALPASTLAACFEGKVRSTVTKRIRKCQLSCPCYNLAMKHSHYASSTPNPTRTQRPLHALPGARPSSRRSSGSSECLSGQRGTGSRRRMPPKALNSTTTKVSACRFRAKMHLWP